MWRHVMHQILSTPPVNDFGASHHFFVVMSRRNGLMDGTSKKDTESCRKTVQERVMRAPSVTTFKLIERKENTADTYSILPNQYRNCK